MPCPPQVPISVIPPVSQGVGPLVWANGNQVARLNPPLNPAFVIYDGSVTRFGDGSIQAPILLPNLQQVAAQDINFYVGLTTTGQLGAFASVTSDPNQALVTATGSNTPRTLANRFADTINALDYGADPTGTNDSTTALQAAINAATNKSLYIPAGTYSVTYLSGISNINIYGDGINKTILKRISSQTNNNSILQFTSNNNFIVKGITFDGNKANQTYGSNNFTVYQCYQWIVEECSFINAKSVSGYGAGFVDSMGLGKTTKTPSIFNNNICQNNDGSGFYLNEDWYITLDGNSFISNGVNGVSVANYVFPPIANVSNSLIITNNKAIYNSGIGIGVYGYYTGGTPSNPYYGPTVPQSDDVVIANNLCGNNGSYGLMFQGSNGSVNGNVCYKNGYSTSYAGGILFNCANSVCSGNSTRDNQVYGIDAGGCFNSVISNNQCQWEGATANASATFINIGASVSCSCIGNNIQMAGSTQCYGIGFAGVDGASSTSPFPTIGSYATISNNSIYLNSNANSVGILISRVPINALISDNYIQGASAVNNGIISYASSQIKGNYVLAADTYNAFIPTFTAASTLVIPDYVETFYITGTTTINNIRTYSQDVFYQKVSDVQVTNGGSGYTPNSSVPVIFSGGGGAGAAATAAVDNQGQIIGVTMTNYGSGYTSPPSVDFSSGSGVGAAGTAIVGVNNSEGRILNILFQSTCAIQNGGNIYLVANVTANNRTTLALCGAYGNWYRIATSVNA